MITKDIFEQAKRAGTLHDALKILIDNLEWDRYCKISAIDLANMMYKKRN